MLTCLGRPLGLAYPGGLLLVVAMVSCRRPTGSQVATAAASPDGAVGGVSEKKGKDPASRGDPTLAELTVLRDKRLATLPDANAAPEFTQDNVPVGLSLDQFKKRYRCKLQRSEHVEFGPLNFVPPFEDVFPVVGGFHMGFRTNNMDYQRLKPGLVTTGAQCDALQTEKFYGVYWRKSDGTVIGVQKSIELKGAAQQIFDTAYESMRQKCKGRMSTPFRGTWLVNRSAERFGAICDEGALRTIVSTNPIYPLSAIITYVDLASWKGELDQDALGVTNTKTDVEKLSGRL
jgi:hypothetical protein